MLLMLIGMGGEAFQKNYMTGLDTHQVQQLHKISPASSRALLAAFCIKKTTGNAGGSKKL